MASCLSSKNLKNPFSVRSNIAATILANVGIAAIYFTSVPLFVRYVGIEGYGLIGFFIFAQGILSVLDLGLNVVLTREFAIEGDGDEESSRLHDILRTAEVFYWIAGIMIGLAWAASAGLLGWFVNAQGLSETTLYQSFLIMAAVIALQMPVSLYSSALFGLQRQAAVSVVGVVFSLLRNLGVVAVLHFVSSAPQIFFGWQLICWMLHVPILMFLARRSLPRSAKKPVFRSELITGKWKFVAEIGVVTLATMLLMHVDKFVLARIVSLEAFGYYALAGVVANGFHWITQPVFRAVMPRFSQLTNDDDRSTLSLLYHQSCQVLALIVFPIAGLWTFFSFELMKLWQQDAVIAANTTAFVTLLVIGAAVSGVLLMPYALQIAFGRTRLQLIAVVSAFAISVPMTIFAAMRWGGIGAAAVGLILNVGIVLFVVPLMHRRLLKGEAMKWFINDLAFPALAVAASGAICRYFFVNSSHVTDVLQLIVALIVMTLVAVASLSLARQWIARRFGRE
jgi:O-antigen/teichoic acid export membrane protein